MQINTIRPKKFKTLCKSTPLDPQKNSKRFASQHHQMQETRLNTLQVNKTSDTKNRMLFKIEPSAEKISPEFFANYQHQMHEIRLKILQNITIRCKKLL